MESALCGGSSQAQSKAVRSTDVTGTPPTTSISSSRSRSLRRCIRIGAASAGVSYNKFLAKIASEERKPNGLCTIHPDQALELIERLPVESFWGVGRATTRRMHELGIRTGADLRERSLQELQRHFGKAGQTFYDYARGIDERPVEYERVRKSIGCEHTFETNTAEPLELEQRLLPSR
mgnify:CR=1 FL=1